MKFNDLLDNRIAQILLLPLAIYNLIQSYLLMKKEGKLFEEVINENDEFFSAMATMNFSPDDKIPFALSSIMPYEKIFTLEEIQEIANETIIKTIIKYVNDETLFGIVLVKCMFAEKNQTVKIIVQPAHYQIYENDRQDVIQSIKIYSVLILLAIIVTYTFKYFSL